MMMTAARREIPVTTARPQNRPTSHASEQRLPTRVVRQGHGRGKRQHQTAGRDRVTDEHGGVGPCRCGESIGGRREDGGRS